MMQKNRVSFEEWKVQVNHIVEGLAGLSCDDLPDVDYYSWYEEHLTPKAAARRAIRTAQEG